MMNMEIIYFIKSGKMTSYEDHDGVEKDSMTYETTISRKDFLTFEECENDFNKCNESLADGFDTETPSNIEACFVKINGRLIKWLKKPPME